ncbi:MAG: extracellular solute-binding protein, partial [Treponema sp.]|nr:extracellular solute-binding protein [Treponema sp.]
MKNKKNLIVMGVFMLIAAQVFSGGGQQSNTAGTGKVSLTAFSVYTPPAAAGNINSFADHMAWKIIEQKYGIHIEWQTVPDQDWAAQLGLVMASKALPDFFIRINPQLAEEYGRQGALMSLTELIDTKIPNLKAIMSNNKAVRGQMTSADGKIYFSPRLFPDPRTRHYPGLMIRE